MYETFFGLKRRPFLAVPDTDSYFSIDAMEEARQNIQRTVRRGEGVSLVFGPSGVGKTLLLRLLRQSLEIDYTVTLIANGHLETPKAFFQQLLFDLRLPYEGGDESELRLQLLDFVRQESSAGFAMLIDESQFLDKSVLEEIRLLMNCDNGAAPFFRAVLAGTAEFEEKLTLPHFEAFNQRVVSRSYLEAFSKEDTYRYIEWQSNVSRGKSSAHAETPVVDADETPDPALGLAEFIQNSGITKGHRIDSPHVKNSEPIFTMSARRQIHQLTGGTPRLINQLCDTSLQLAAERLLRQVDEVLVHSAWARLQQIDAVDISVPTEDVAAPSGESIDEIIARKKATFQPKAFDSSVQFGSLADSETPEPEEEPADGPEMVNETVDTEGAVTEIATPQIVVSSVVLDETDPDSWAYDDTTELEPAMQENDEEISSETEDDVDITRFDVVFDETPPRRRAIHPVRRKRKLTKYSQKYFTPQSLSEPIDVRGNIAQTLSEWASIFLTLRRFDVREDWIGNTMHRPLFSPARCHTFPVVEIVVEAETLTEDTESAMLEEPSDAVAVETEAELETAVAVKAAAEVVAEEEMATPEPEASAEEMPGDEQIPEMDPEIEEASMDPETLERYGVAILDGRPPFVRKEPNYAYQTTETTSEADSSEYCYPDPSTGNLITLRWILPEQRNDLGFGTAYRDFFESQLGRQLEHRRFEQERAELAAKIVRDTTNVVRLRMEQTETPPNGTTTAIDETFDEIAAVLKQVVALDNLYRSSLGAGRPLPLEGPLSTWNESVFPHQMEAIVQRMAEAAERIEQAAAVGRLATEKFERAAEAGHRAFEIIELAAEIGSQAAGKFEQAAEVGEAAGRHIQCVANFVDTEVRSALPSYIELFQELSDFQQTISEELTFVRELRRIAQSNVPLSASLSEKPSVGEAMSDLSAERTNSPQRTKRILPFPKRPDFASLDEKESAPENGAVSMRENSEDGIKDDLSIDVRTLFQ